MSNASLVAKETILGVLIANSKGNYTLHTSDFKCCLDNVGIPWGSSVAEDCMLHCKSDKVSIDVLKKRNRTLTLFAL